MVPFNAFVLLIALTIVSFIFTTFQGFMSFHKQTHSLEIWDTTGLASASRVAKETNTMLLDFRDSLLESIASYDPNNGSVNQNYNDQRLTILKNYFAGLNLDHPNILKNTIEFGLSPYNNQGYQKNYQNYQASLSHSDYLPTKFNPSDKSYASSLISDSQNSNIISVNDLENQIIIGGSIKISSSLLNQLLESDQALLIQNNPGIFGLIITDDGLSSESLPNGIELNVTM